MEDLEKKLEITCRNCEETFSVPEGLLSHPDVPCPECGFINSLTGLGNFSGHNILAKLAPVFGDADESGGSSINIGGGIGLVLVVILVIIYTQLSSVNLSGTAPATAANTITNSTGMQLSLIPAGTFSMGSSHGSEDEKPVHPVIISKPFFMGIHEVTVSQWIEVMQEQPLVEMPLDKPILLVTWDQARQFCAKLSLRENASYRLPTEAEWEYAIKAGSSTEFYWGDLYAEGYGWCHLNSGRPTRSTHPVGTLRPNAWGLYDMSGNAGEWCADYYGNYSAADQVDPTGPTEGTLRVVRGGDYTTIPAGLRSASRGHATPDLPGPGFRVVKDL